MPTLLHGGGSSPDSRRPRFTGLWRNRDFLLFWGGETVSLLGTQLTLLALPLTAVLLLGATPAQMGLLTVAEFAPFILFTLFAGVWLDRVRRRPMLVASNLARGVLVASVPLAAFMGWLSVEYLYVVLFLTGAMAVIFELAYQSFLPTLLRREELVEGNSKLFASASATEVGGPGIAGVLIALLSAPFVLLIDAVSFLLAGAALWRVRTVELAPTPKRERTSIRRDIALRLRATFGNPLLRAFAAEATAYNFFNQVFITLFVLFATRQLGFGPELLGLIFAGGSLGALAGAMLARPVAKRLGLGRTILTGAMISCFSPLLIPLSALAGSFALPMLLLGFFTTGFGISLTNVHVFSIRQSLMPESMRGRMIASYRFITWGAIPVGAALSGLMAEWIGLWPTMLGGALGLTTAWLWFLFSPVRRLREMPTVIDPSGEPSGAAVSTPLRPAAEAEAA
jgi:MFS family permease